MNQTRVAYQYFILILIPKVSYTWIGTKQTYSETGTFSIHLIHMVNIHKHFRAF